MPIRTALWKVTAQPEQLPEAVLPSEKLLEDMIVAQPLLLSDAWMLIGRQERTGQGGIIDLLAIAPDGSLVLIEIKRDRTPRDVVAQALDYASWVASLQMRDIDAIYRRFKAGQSLSDDFRARFGQPLDEETLNQSHQIVIVAAQLDDSSERIVAYLNKRGIAINVLCFQVFAHGADQLLSRAWLLDPVHTQLNVTPPSDGPAEPWNGEFYVSFGDALSRSWAEAMQYPWDYVRTQIQLRAWARLLYCGRRFVIHGREMSLDVADKFASNTVFLRELIEDGMKVSGLNWHPDDYALSGEESCAAKNVDTLPDVLKFLRDHGLAVDCPRL